MCGEDNDVMYKNMYKAYDPLKVIFLRRSEKPNLLSFSLQVFMQQWGENNYVVNQWKYEMWNVTNNLLSVSLWSLRHGPMQHPVDSQVVPHSPQLQNPDLLHTQVQMLHRGHKHQVDSGYLVRLAKVC